MDREGPFRPASRTCIACSELIFFKCTKYNVPNIATILAIFVIFYSL